MVQEHINEHRREVEKEEAREIESRIKARYANVENNEKRAKSDEKEQ